MPKKHDGHCGVAEGDPRNRAPIAVFEPKKVSEESTRELLIRSLPHASVAQIEIRVQQVMQRIATGPIKPAAPLSQSLEQVDDLHYGLGTHPDIIKHMWKLGRVDKSNPDANAGKQHEGREALDEFIVAGGNPA